MNVKVSLRGKNARVLFVSLQTMKESSLKKMKESEKKWASN